MGSLECSTGWRFESSTDVTELITGYKLRSLAQNRIAELFWTNRDSFVNVSKWAVGDNEKK